MKASQTGAKFGIPRWNGNEIARHSRDFQMELRSYVELVGKKPDELHAILRPGKILDQLGR